MRSFHSHCTVPLEGIAFVSSPDIRGTLGIVWSCFSVLLLSTWSILYLNVPVSSTPCTDTQKYWRMCYRFLSKVNWMALNILAPEWPLAKAWSDYCSTSSLIQEFERLQYSINVPWGRAHVYLSNMGGFGIKFDKIGVQRTSLADNARSERSSSSERDPHGIDTISEPTATRADQENSHQADAQPVNIAPPLSSNVSERLHDSPSTARPVTNSTSNVVPPSNHTIAPENGRPEQDSDRSEQARNQIEMRKTGVHNLPVPSLPVSVQAAIQRWLNQERFGKAFTQKSIGRLSKKIGPIPWNLDYANAEAVQAAAHEVKLKDFKNAAEKHRFLIGSKVWFDNLHALQGDVWIVDAHQLLLIRQMGIIGTLPFLTEDDLDGRNRTDVLVTLLALGQLLWFSIQLIARLVHYHRTTQLEVITFAFSICSLITYYLVWDKPKDVQTSIFVNAVRYPTPEELTRIAVVGPWIFGKSAGVYGSPTMQFIGSQSRARTQ